ncbi:TSUP family transporter [Butyrivibrio sp. WCD3002]|uniref:TSUP family transporter n=1 Tax=Butyrivibrio sp. WCD3002 TaxID=1280676 RepID=UPI002E8DF204|nr:TSUP family transporter [Butyrivibrio sp. WCD3002]
MLFLAGFVDSIAGGGGLISLPAYMLAGLPIHNAIATNKLSSSCGTSLSLMRFIKHKLINFKVAIPAVIAGMFGSYFGARLSLFIKEIYLRQLLLVILPVAAFIVLNKKLFKDNGKTEVEVNTRTILVVIVSALVIGMYDGLYGPGTGTFLIIAFTTFAKMGIGPANAHTKAINTATNLSSLVVFILSGQVIIALGIAAAVCNMLGNYVGSGLAMKKSTRITKPIILTVLLLLLIKIILS